MGNKEDSYAELERYMKQGNLSIAGLLIYREKFQSELLSMPESVMKKYKTYYEQLESDQLYYKNSKKHLLNKRERGRVFEDIIGCLFFSGNALFNKAINCRTSTNEIDLLIDWTDMATQARINEIYSFMGKSFLCECKNYEDGVGVTYVGKFYALMRVNNSNFGILFTSSRIKGRGEWDSAKGLIKKIALKDNAYIIDITWEDLTKIYRNETNILSILRDKYNALKNNISYDKYIIKHELQEEFMEKKLEYDEARQ